MNPARRYHGVKRAKHIVSIWDACGMLDWGKVDIRPHLLQRAVHTRVRCSCDGCGNQRKVEGPTLNERRSMIDMHEQLHDVA